MQIPLLTISQHTDGAATVRHLQRNVEDEAGRVLVHYYSVSNSMNLTAGDTKNASSYARMARMFRGMKLMKLAKATRTLRALSTIVSMYNALQAVQQKQKLSPRFVQKQNVLNDLGVTHLVCEVIATGDDAARGGVHPFLEKAIELGVQLLEV